MDFTRIRSAIDVDRMQRSHVTIVGSAPMLTANLFRCGLGAATLIDPQNVEPPNIARQDYLATAIGVPKVKALADHVRRINTSAQVTCVVADFCALKDSEIDFHVGTTNLIIGATDYFPAQARVNELALRRGIPALWLGLGAGARNGEGVFWHPGVDSCFRCLMARRYVAQELATKEGRSLDPASEGADIFSIQLLDAIGGHMALGQLTRGADNRFGRLIDQLGCGADARNLIQIKLDPIYTFGGRDVFREQLKIPAECDAYFSWTAIVRRDNPLVHRGCRDCTIYRGHYWAPMGHCGMDLRVKPNDSDYDEVEAERQRARYLAEQPFSRPS